MTGEATVVCTKCGFLNAAGDQFCGSCGAFLEWEGSVVDGMAGALDAAGPGKDRAASAAGSGDATAAATSGPPASVAPPAPTSGSTGRGTPAGAPTAGGGAPTGAAQPGVTAGAALVRCPACGVANAASRTFCQSCGARLVAAAPVAPRSREEIAAAVASVQASAPAASPVTAPGVARSTAPVGAGARRSSGVPLWIVVVILAGVLVGVGVIVVPQALRGLGPVSVASTAPSAAASGAAGSSGTAASPAASSASGTGAPASPKPSPATARALRLTSASASSVVQGDTARYGAGNAIDGNPKTSWQEGAATEKGQWLEVAFDPATVTAVQIRNGYGASTALYKGNLRLKDVQISIDGGVPLTIRLRDTASPQRVDLPATPGATRLRITIVTTYPSVKTSVAGTPFDDAAVSEVSVLGIPGG